MQFSFLHLPCLTLLFAIGIVCAPPAHANIPASERQVLLDLYTSTNGDSWTNHANWNGAAGTECTWTGVSCDAATDAAATHVTGISLSNNNLTGTLPLDLNGLTEATSIYVDNNALQGGIPSLQGLTKLQDFYANDNQLAGSLPGLVGLPALILFEVRDNQIGGILPAWSGLPSFAIFDADNNQLTGSIPDLSGVPSLYSFEVNFNHLSGSMPSDLLAGLPHLQTFDAGLNQLTGSIPEVAGHGNLSSFNVRLNQLTGSLPSLVGLPNLHDFQADQNQLTGTIPSLSGLGNLGLFWVSQNQLSGAIPDLSGLSQLIDFSADANQLTGAIPSLSGLTSLQRFHVANNRLSGDLPDVPTPNALVAAQSSLCPNALNASANSAWDAATGSTPWYTNCAGNVALSGTVFADSNGSGVQDSGELGTNATSATLTVYAVDAGGNVAGSASLQADGDWSIASGLAASTSYTLVLSNTGGVAIGSPAPAASLPSGWVNEGENAGGVLDATVDGRFAGATTPASEGVTSSYNFGIYSSNALCGPNDGQTLLAAPTQLCTVGAASTVGGSGHPWTWTCTQSGTTTSTAQCSATLRTWTATATVQYDAGGTVTPASITVDNGGQATFTLAAQPNASIFFVNTMGCTGTLSGNIFTTDPLTTNCQLLARFTINGVCGSANGQTFNVAPTANLCSSGTPSAVTGTGPWAWTCAPGNSGNGGNTGFCSAQVSAVTEPAIVPAPFLGREARLLLVALIALVALRRVVRTRRRP